TPRGVMCFSRTLYLRHVAAIQLAVARVGDRVGDMPLEADGHEPVPSAPDEQRVGLKPSEAGPEAVRAVRLVEVDVPGGGVERGTPRGREIRAEELVDAGGRPSVAGAG